MVRRSTPWGFFLKELVLPADTCTMTNMNTTPDLTEYDLILIQTSAGKDSQAMLDHLHSLASEAGVLDRVVLVHCDLGRIEWPGTRELAEEHADHYGLRLEIVRREKGDLIAQIRARGMFPSSTARYCTSDQKRDQAAKVITAEVNRLRAEGLDRQARILVTMGFRAEESPARAKRPVFTQDKRTSNGKRSVDVWLPIHDWTETQVWDRIEEAGTRAHWAYEAGMPRLSCSFCVLASRGALVKAAQLRPELAAEYAALEVEIGHTFQNGTSMGDIIEQAATETAVEITNWNA